MSDFQKIVSSQTTTPRAIEEFMSAFQHTSLHKITQLLTFAHYVLQSQQYSPRCKNNVLCSLISLVKKCHYPSLMIVQHIFLQMLDEPARVAASGNANEIYDYFKNPDYQVQSFHFTKNSLFLYFLLASIKPKKLYRARELNSLSKAKKMYTVLQNENRKQDYQMMDANHCDNFAGLRKLFFANLNAFNKNHQPYIDFFILQLEVYISESQTTLSFTWLKTIAIQGDHFLASQALFRLSQIVCSHSSFNVRKRCFQLFCQFLQNGSLLALLILNFTQNLMRMFLQMGKCKQTKRQAVFFPQIEGQRLQKQAFVNLLLSKLKTWSLLFPTLQRYVADHYPSPLLQIFTAFSEAGIQFPDDRGPSLKVDIQRNFQEQAEYNKAMLSQLYKIQISDEFQMDPSHVTLQTLTRYYQKYKSKYEYLLSTQIFWLPYQFQELLVFKRNFPVYSKSLTIKAEKQEIFNQLIKDSQQLMDKISSLQEVYYPQTSQKTLQTSKQFKQTSKNSLDYFKEKAHKSISHIILSKESQHLQKKLHLRMKELASSRSLILWQISSLQLNSRPFLAYNLHSKQITENLLPTLRLSPSRSTKRLRAGIKLVQRSEESIQNFQKADSHLMTPRFRSVLNQPEDAVSKEHRKRGGLKPTINKKKYIPYISYLRRREDIVHFTNEEMALTKNAKVVIQREELSLSNYCLTVKYRCWGIQKSHLFTYSINEEPSISLSAHLELLTQDVCQVIVEGKILKFGYSIPTISFFIQKQLICEVPLPFAFNNFIKISSDSQTLDLQSLQSFSISENNLLDTERFRSLRQIQKYLRGSEVKGDKLWGQVEFYCYKCVFQMQLNHQRLMVKTFSQKAQNNILFQFLPLFLASLFGRSPMERPQF